ncbi:MAG: hypothetical protein IPG70_06575 [Moraxellaceae bacterium]|nr:hypothetical protein [Moraxellaceae bacterium]
MQTDSVELLGYRIHYILRASRTLEQLTHSEAALANAQRFGTFGAVGSGIQNKM